MFGFFDTITSGVKSFLSPIQTALSGIGKLGSSALAGVGSLFRDTSGAIVPGITGPTTQGGPGLAGTVFGPDIPSTPAPIPQSQITPTGPGLIGSARGGEGFIPAPPEVINPSFGISGAVRPATVSRPQPAQTGQAGQPSGQIFQTTPSIVTNRPAPAATAAAGQTGVSAAGPQFVFSPVTGQPGVVGGTSAFTGLLGGVGGIGTPAVPTTGDVEEDERTRREGIQTTELGAITPQEQLQIPSAPDVIDLSRLEGITNATMKVLQSSEALSDDDLAQVRNTLSLIVDRNRARVDSTDPTPAIPVVDTQEQTDFLTGLDNVQRGTIREQMDNVRKELGMPQFEAERIDIMKQLQATNDAFSEIIDSVTNNPDLPKGLAFRRIKEIQNEQKLRISQLTGQLGIINQAIEDANSSLNREFNIIQAEKSDEERARDNARQNLNIMIQSGAVGAFTPGDVAGFATATGLSTSVISKIVNAANEPDVKVTGNIKDGFSKITTDAQGNIKIDEITAPQPGAGVKRSEFTTNIGGTNFRIVTEDGVPVQQIPLGQAGEQSLSEKKNQVNLFVQTQLVPLENKLNKDDVRKAINAVASGLGIALTTDELDDLVNSVNTKFFSSDPETLTALGLTE